MSGNLFFDDWNTGSDLIEGQSLDAYGGKGGGIFGGGSMDPMTTTALLNAGSNVLGTALKPAGSTNQSRAESGANVEAVFNHDWTVTFGDQSPATQERSQLPAIGGGMNTTLIIALVGAVIAWKLLKKPA